MPSRTGGGVRARAMSEVDRWASGRAARRKSPLPPKKQTVSTRTSACSQLLLCLVSGSYRDSRRWGWQRDAGWGQLRLSSTRLFRPEPRRPFSPCPPYCQHLPLLQDPPATLRTDTPPSPATSSVQDEMEAQLVQTLLATLSPASDTRLAGEQGLEQALNSPGPSFLPGGLCERPSD